MSANGLIFSGAFTGVVVGVGAVVYPPADYVYVGAFLLFYPVFALFSLYFIGILAYRVATGRQMPSSDYEAMNLTIAESLENPRRKWFMKIFLLIRSIILFLAGYSALIPFSAAL